MHVCSCREVAELCDACVVSLEKQFGGVAQARGSYYADGVWKRYRARAWDWDKARAIARRKLRDLTKDARLIEVLAEEWLTGARQRIEQGDTPLAELALRRARHGMKAAEPQRPLADLNRKRRGVSRRPGSTS